MHKRDRILQKLEKEKLYTKTMSTLVETTKEHNKEVYRILKVQMESLGIDYCTQCYSFNRGNTRLYYGFSVFLGEKAIHSVCATCRMNWHTGGTPCETHENRLWYHENNKSIQVPSDAKNVQYEIFSKPRYVTWPRVLLNYARFKEIPVSLGSFGLHSKNLRGLLKLKPGVKP